MEKQKRQALEKHFSEIKICMYIYKEIIKSFRLFHNFSYQIFDKEF